LDENYFSILRKAEGAGLLSATLAQEKTRSTKPRVVNRYEY